MDEKKEKPLKMAKPNTSLTPAALKNIQRDLTPLNPRRKLDYLLARPAAP